MRTMLFLCAVLSASTAFAQPGNDPPPPPPVSDIVLTAAWQSSGWFLGISCDYCEATAAVANHEGQVQQCSIYVWEVLTGKWKLVKHAVVPVGASVVNCTWIAGDQGVGSVSRQSHYLVFAVLHDGEDMVAADTRDTEVVPN